MGFSNPGFLPPVALSPRLFGSSSPPGTGPVTSRKVYNFNRVFKVGTEQ